jgi:hypothetical protein
MTETTYLWRRKAHLVGVTQQQHRPQFLLYHRYHNPMKKLMNAPNRRKSAHISHAVSESSLWRK